LDEPAVQQRLGEDPELRALWRDPAVRQGLTDAEAMMIGMSKLMELVRRLTEDPAVRTRIDAAPTLRELWSDPDVRHHFERSVHH
jgi:hypothetical protein